MSTHNTSGQRLHDTTEATPTINDLEYSAYPAMAEGSGWPSGLANRIVYEAIPTLDLDFLACIDPVLREQSTTTYRHGDRELIIRSLHETREGGHRGGSSATTAEGSGAVKGRRARGKKKKRENRPRIGVILLEDDDGSGPNLPKDPRGYALPDAAMAFIATPARHALATKYFDGLFFPSHEKHEQDATRGHICRVRMRIGRDGGGRPVWVPMEKNCESQMTGESYRRHLLGAHLGTPREGKKSPITRAVKQVAARKRKRDDDPEYQPVSRFEPLAQKGSKRQKTT